MYCIRHHVIDPVIALNNIQSKHRTPVLIEQFVNITNNLFHMSHVPCALKNNHHPINEIFRVIVFAQWSDVVQYV